MKKKKILIIPAILLFALAGFVIWGFSPLPAEAVALEAGKTDGAVTISQQGSYFLFEPTDFTQDTGIIFYPGGHVDPQAYNHLLREIAADGYPVILVPMPLNLAVLGSQKADTVIQDFPQIETWVIAGHSVGGAMAANYAGQHPDQISGLILWASYPPDNVDLTTSGIKTLSIYGSLDGLSTPDKIEQSRQNLPGDTVYHQIVGGNHAQFGSYGLQNGDLPAKISASEQQSIIVTTTIDFLATLP